MDQYCFAFQVFLGEELLLRCDVVQIAVEGSLGQLS